jgi:hypothetical protein
MFGNEMLKVAAGERCKETEKRIAMKICEVKDV